MATKTDLERPKTDLAWRMIAVVDLFGTVITHLNAIGDCIGHLVDRPGDLL